MNIFEELKRDYLIKIGMKEIPENRQASSVEARAALSNAMIPYCRLRNIGPLWNLDRSTIHNYKNKHTTYIKTSANYRRWFYVASEIVEQKINQQPYQTFLSKSKMEQRDREQLVTISKTIEILNQIHGKIKQRVRPNKSKSLQEVHARSLEDYAQGLGQGSVHSILRDEQFQVSDESRGQADSINREGHRESEMVRTTGKSSTQ